MRNIAPWPTPLARHRLKSAQALRITHPPSSAPRLVDSATPMNESGSSSPQIGCRQRTSASAPTTAPVHRSTSGR